MQDRYAFDQGDFSKLGLLRVLAGETQLRLGVVWYRAEPSPRERANGDGRHVGYLQRDPGDRWRACDPELYRALGAGLARGERTIAALERAEVWPAGTIFFGEAVPRADDARAAWFQRARAAVQGAQLVCCDPDNGLAGPGRSPSPKHLAEVEAEDLFAAGASLVLYHHFDRSRPHLEQLAGLVARVEARLGPTARVRGLRYRRGTSRAYLVCARPEHAAAIERALAALDRSPWRTGGHFE